jgi:hypothetical protein
LFVSDLSVTILYEGSVLPQAVGNDVVALPYIYTVK